MECRYEIRCCDLIKGVFRVGGTAPVQPLSFDRKRRDDQDGGHEGQPDSQFVLSDLIEKRGERDRNDQKDLRYEREKVAVERDVPAQRAEPDQQEQRRESVPEEISEFSRDFSPAQRHSDGPQR